jgi:hypothetical protein
MEVAEAQRSWPKPSSSCRRWSACARTSSTEVQRCIHENAGPVPAPLFNAGEVSAGSSRLSRATGFPHSDGRRSTNSRLYRSDPDRSQRRISGRPRSASAGTTRTPARLPPAAWPAGVLQAQRVVDQAHQQRACRSQQQPQPEEACKARQPRRASPASAKV